MTRVLKALVPAVALLAACGSAKSSAEVVAAAPGKTVAERTAKISQRLRITPSPDAGGEASPVVLTGKGAVDFANRRGRVVTNAGGQTIEAVFAGTTVYQHIPAMAAAGGGRDWFKVDFDTLGEAVGVEGLGNLLQSQSSDPAASLQYLRGASGEVTKVGKEPIRGVDTTWYSTTVDLSRAAAEAPPEVGKTIRQITEAFGIERIPVEVWIDSSGRARRVRQEVDYSSSGAAGRFPAGTLPESVEITLEFYDFGTSVSVELPPADEVADLADAVRRLESGVGSGTASPATDALEARLLSDVPTGYEQQADNVGDTGPSDLEKAIRDDTEPDARKVLTDDRFVAGYQRLWAKAVGEGTIIDFVYEFETPEGATHYMARMVSGLTGGDAEVTPFEVTGVPAAKGLRTTDADDPAAVVILTRGRYLAQVVVGGPDAGSSLPVELARQQFGRLG